MRVIILFVLATAWALYAEKSAKGQSACDTKYELSVAEVIPNKNVKGEYLLGRPKEVMIDDKYVYVLDEAAFAVKVYKKDGTPERIIGSKGRGPGEFMSVDAAAVDDSSLYIVDNLQRRIARFSKEGRVDETYPMKSLGIDDLGSVQEMEARDGVLILIESISRPSLTRQDKKIVHVVEDIEKRKSKSYISLGDIKMYSDFEMSFTYFDPGGVVTKNKKIYYTKGVFEKNMYKINIKKDTYNKIEKRRYFMIDEDVYETADYEKVDSYEYMKFTTATKRIAGRPSIMNNGLFEDGESIVRFTYSNLTDGGTTFIERMKMEDLSTESCGRIDHDGEATIYPPKIQIFARSDSGMYYAVDRTSAPVVKAFLLREQKP